MLDLGIMTRTSSGTKERRMANGIKFLEVADVARILALSPMYVRELASAGRLPVAATTVRGSRLFDAAAIEAVRRTREQARGVLVARLRESVEGPCG
jgi:hypothetical protein